MGKDCILTINCQAGKNNRRIGHGFSNKRSLCLDSPDRPTYSQPEAIPLAIQ